MQRFRTRLRLSALLVVAGLLAAACSGGGGKTGGSDSNDSKSTTLTVAAAGVVSNLDSEKYQGFISIDLLPNVAGTLVRFKKPASDATTLQTPDQIEPELAESWQVSDDKKSVDFTLQASAKSPFGNPVTSADVEWSIKRMLNSKGVPIAKILMGIGGWDTENPITVKDPTHFTLHFTSYNAVSLSILSTFFMTIYDSVEAKKHATADDPYAYEWLASNTATFGPYTVESFDPGKQVRLVANKNYFRGQPKVANVVIRAVPDAASRLQLVESGGVDITSGLSFDQQSSLKSSKAADLQRMLYPSITTFVLNVKVKPFNDVRVRQALSYAVDRNAILQSVYRGFGTAATDFFHDDFGVTGVEGITRDPAKAKALLAEAGYPNGFPLTLSYNVANVGPESEQIAVLLRSQLKEVGVDVKLDNIASGADFDAGKRSGKLTSWLGTSLPLVPDPAYYLAVFYSTGGLTNQSGYSNPALDKAEKDILLTPPGADRMAKVKAIDEAMVADMPAVPLIDSQKFFAFRKAVSGLFSSSQGHIDYASLSFK
jgi:peptide/nickel transport system substrate-binding protein